ncbi:PorT family protein [Flavobacteriaceae bacterium TP-CH-4]|uniref:PorT family protein n=1 Tax=Pelagihabitans pacificus TaxID=2696054 RepID=A0A967AWN5_9FLAO|nr:porin family protein [Pelagihabitans pacificus]NHF61297.1 PorT family protein [Pelagihabitans pacificus]
MKKILVASLFSFFTASTLFAQGTFKFGVTGGLLNSNADIDFSIFSVDLLNIDAVNKYGFYVGAIADVGVSDKFHVQPELTYGSAGDLAYIYLPIMAKYYIIPKLYAMAGPQISFSSNLDDIKDTIRDIDDITGANTNLDDVLRTTGVDLGFGAGFDILENLSAQARYSIELTNRYTGPLDNSLTIRASTFNLGIAYFF